MANDFPFKTIKLVLLSLEKQGSVVRETKSGWMVRFPNGESMTMHKSPSDNRAIKNIRGRVLRAGLDWPLDPAKK